MFAFGTMHSPEVMGNANLMSIILELMHSSLQIVNPA